VVVSHQAVNRIVLAGLDPGLGAPEEVPQETGCFNTILCHGGAGSQLTWRVVSVNELPPAFSGMSLPAPEGVLPGHHLTEPVPLGIGEVAHQPEQ
jgi:hypothetical protein